jgi:hypothetical protein
MPRLGFRLLGPGALEELDLPVEIRTRALDFAASVFSSQDVELPAGEYLVSATIPGGRLLLEKVTLGGTGGLCEIHLAGRRPQSDPEIEAEEREIAARSELLRSGRERPSVSRTARFVTRVLESAGPPGVWLERRFNQWRGLRLRLLTGDPLAGEMRTLPANELTVVHGDRHHRVEVEVAGGEESRWLQLEAPGQPLMRLAVPASTDASAVAVVQRVAASRFLVDLHPRHPQADLVLGHWQAGNPAETLSACGAASLHVGSLLAREKPDLAAVLLAVYATLRFGDVDAFEEVADRAAQLSERFARLPDSSSILGEVAA